MAKMITCSKCGKKFEKSSLLRRLVELVILVDPAPSSQGYRCPHCGFKNS